MFSYDELLVLYPNASTNGDDIRSNRRRDIKIKGNPRSLNGDGMAKKREVEGLGEQ